MAVAKKKKRQPNAEPNLTAKFHLAGIRLCKSHSQLELDGSEVPTKIKIQVNAAYNVNAAEKMVRFLCECVVTTVHEPDNPPAVSIGATYECFYEATSDEAMTLVDQLLPGLSMSAQFHAWPYLRRHIHQASIDMAVAPILLPLYNPKPPQIKFSADAKTK